MSESGPTKASTAQIETLWSDQTWEVIKFPKIQFYLVNHVECDNIASYDESKETYQCKRCEERLPGSIQFVLSSGLINDQSGITVTDTVCEKRE